MSRVSKSLKNAKVGVFFFIASIFIQFFSRKIFLDNLGDEFMGLESTLRSVLSFLNMAELGVSTAIGFALYKPIFDKDHKEINKIVALLGVLYRKIGLIILGVGCIISLFFPMMFDNNSFPFGLIYFVFYSLLFSTMLSYFVNYHINLLGVDQKGYIVQQYYQTFNIIKVILQALVAIYLKDFYIYISLELIFNITYSIIVRYKIKREYPWLIINLEQKAELIKEYPDIIKTIKQVFFHKISSFVKNGTDNILIFALINVQSVAFFGNYQLIFTKLDGLVRMAFAGTGSAVGNLIAENDRENINKVFWELIAIQFFIAGFFTIIIFHVMNPFILIWLGDEKYILSKSILFLMLGNFFMLQISTPVERFKNAYGLYSDTWAAVAEAIINLGISYFFGRIYGIAGIMFGTLISMLLIIVIWKPYFLYRYGFNQSVWLYWKGLLPILLIFVGSAILVNYASGFFPHDMENASTQNWSKWIDWMIFAFKISVLVILTYGISMFLFIPGFRVFCFRMKHLVYKRTSR